jgi:LPS-assembly protein
MKKHLIVSILALSAFSIQADGVNLTCAPYQPLCVNCPEYQTLFPVEVFSNDSESLDVEADKSEITANEAYQFSGNVELKSDSFFLAADDIEVFTSDNSTQAKGNVRFQDDTYLITGDLLSAKKVDGELIATATNANYQDISVGPGGANGYTEVISKTPSSVFLTNATYSLCPVNKNDWLIDADSIELNLEKNRGIADNATVVFYGIPIFYLPKYSWVLEGRGSGFLTPSYDSYTEISQTKRSYSLRVPYYFNIAPDRDLVVAMKYMSSRGFIYEGKYRQLITPKIIEEDGDSLFEIETRYLSDDKITNLNRWLIDTSIELDISKKTHLSAQYYRVSDAKYFEEVARTNTNVKTIKSNLKLNYDNPSINLKAAILTEDVQVVNAGTPVYTRALEGSISKTFNADNKLPIQVDVVSTKFAHDTPGKESGVRTHTNLGVSRVLSSKFPVITTRANVGSTYYRLDNSNNLNRTIAGTGLDLAFPFISQGNLYGSEVNHTLTPRISYNYRAKEVQGNIPIFDSTDKYDDIITFADLTSGERYTGLDRITNANDFTLSIVSSHRDVNALDDDKDLLNMKIAQSYYTDDEVVSDTANTDYETRRSYSDIAASINIAINNFTFGTAVQFDPDQSSIVKRTNSLSYILNPRKFVSMSVSDNAVKEDDGEKIAKFYGAFPLNDSIHLFGGLDRTTSTGVTNSETTGIAYESCCWAFRLAHFKEDNGLGGYNYSTGAELVLSGLGSTSSPLKDRIEARIPDYSAKLRYKP